MKVGRAPHNASQPCPPPGNNKKVVFDLFAPGNRTCCRCGCAVHSWSMCAGMRRGTLGGTMQAGMEVSRLVWALAVDTPPYPFAVLYLWGDDFSFGRPEVKSWQHMESVMRYINQNRDVFQATITFATWSEYLTAVLTSVDRLVGARKDAGAGSAGHYPCCCPSAQAPTLPMHPPSSSNPSPCRCASAATAAGSWPCGVSKWEWGRA